jgi:hypothetical protein
VITYFQFTFCQELETDRPDQTESPSIIPKGFFQLETGPILERAYSEINLSLFSSLYRYGVSDNFEFRLIHELSIKNFGSFEGQQPELEFSDITFGGKYRFLKSDAQLALMAYLVIPSGSDNEGSKKLGIVTKLALAHDLSENAEIGYNIGYNYLGSGKGDLTFTTSLGLSITTGTGFFTEIYGSVNDLKKTEFFYDNGFTFLIKENFQIDFSFGTGISSRYNFVSAGISWRMPK